MDPSPSLDSQLDHAVRHERAAGARAINPLRFATVGFFFALFLTFGALLGHREWRSNLALFASYFVASALVFVASRHWQTVAELSGYAIAFFDMPVVYTLQRGTLGTSTSPGAVAGFTIAIFAGMVVVSLLSLDLKQISATTLSATVLGMLLQYEGGITLGGMLSTPVVLSLIALTGLFLYRRLLELTRRLLEGARKRGQLEAQLEHADRMATMGTLAASIAHEVGNPLTYLLGNLELAKVKAERDSLTMAELRELLDEAELGATRIATIVRDMRGMARKEVETIAREVDIKRVLEGTLSMARGEIRRRAELVVLLGDVPVVMVDETRLSQVFLNLLVNAAQAIPERIEGEASVHQVTVSTGTGPAGEAIVSVTDTGHGIKAEDRERLFTPFFTTKPKGQGTGLGLSICAQLVRNAGGRIEVDSEVGKGTTFRVLLPALGAAPLTEITAR